MITKRDRQSLLSYIPFIHLFFSFASNYVFFDSPLVGNLVGYSILTDIFYIIVLSDKRFCIYSKIAATSLIFLNIFGILGDYINYYKYSALYDSTLMLTTVSLIVIKYIEKNANDKNATTDNSKSGRI